MHLTKHHGLGNDFLVAFVDEVPADAPDLAIDLCDRRTGLGADGLLFGIDQDSVPTMHLFNSDGSAAEVSGNGLRCFVQALAMRRGVQRLEVDVATRAGTRACVVEPTGRPDVVEASVDMGAVAAGDPPDTPSFLDTVDGLDGVRQWAIGSVGNPHVVIEVDDPDRIDLAAVGPQIEKHFPHGVNAHFVAASGPDRLQLRVWERGAGITQACGTGACASAQAALQWGLVAASVDHVVVHMDG